MDNFLLKNLGAFALAVQNVQPQSSAAATIDGNTVDRLQHQNPLTCLMHLAVGAVNGAPTGFTVQAQLQHAPDGATWTNYSPDGITSTQTGAIVTANTDLNSSIDLTSAARYIRMVVTIAFTGGSSPAVLVSADIVLGGQNLLPAV